MYDMNDIKSVYEMAKKLNPPKESFLEKDFEADFLFECTRKFGFPILNIAGSAYNSYHRNGYIPTFEIKKWYRIGKPILDEGGFTYKNSWNFAENRREDGISVITKEWLNSFKAIFFNITDEAVQKKGIYEIEGFVIGKGKENHKPFNKND